MKTNEELLKENEKLQQELRDCNTEIESLKEEISYKQDELDEISDQLETAEEEETRLNSLLDEYEAKVTLDTSNLMEQQKAELLKIAQKKFTLQELEEMFGGNSFTL